MSITNAPKILIVEDEDVLRKAFDTVLKTGGYEVGMAENGLEGIRLMKEMKPDLVLLDVFMPVMDGREFLRNIDLDDYPNTAVIVYSNLSDPKTEDEMRDLGATDFVLKASLTPRELLAMVQMYL
jgi:CheY-like chemotaxis protein